MSFQKNEKDKIKSIGFDFDGTLIDSEKYKLEIIKEIFYKKYGITKGVVPAYKSLLGKANRKGKLRILIRKFLNREPQNKEIKELNHAFSKGYEYKLSHCPLAKCTEMLEKIKNKVSFMFLLTLEEKDVVEKIMRHCGISKYFDVILGGPKSKINNFNYLCKKYKIKPEETLYIGDSKGDIINSKKLKFNFMGINSKKFERMMLNKLGADFTFSDLCEIPIKHITHGHMYEK